jgi:DNA-binding PucR family transcriptional regulator
VESSPALSALMPALRADLPDLLDDVAAALAQVDPAYAEFLAGGRDEVLPAAEYAISLLVSEAAEVLGEPALGLEGGAAAAESADVAFALFEALGRDQWRRDQPVRLLLSAYQLGGRVTWRRIAAVAMRQALPTEALVALAEAVFRLVDEISAATISGFVEEQAQSATERERLRDVLAERLLSDRADSAVVARAAQAAGWPLPADAAVVLLRPDDEPGREVLGRMTPSALLLRHTAVPGAILPDPDAPGRRSRLAAQLRGTTAVVGPTVPLAQLPESARVAQVAAQTFQLDAGHGPLFTADRLDAIIVHRDRRLLDALREAELGPLTAATPASRVVLRQTLRSWLVHMGNRRAVAEELGIHPQTVRYRLARVRELFGPVLDDPASRLRLLLALGWEPGPEEPVPELTEPVPDPGSAGARSRRSR